jgi:hypothetical protein
MEEIVSRQLRHLKRRHVRFGSLADICSAKGHVRFAPNSDRESEFPQTVMSALPSKADMCGATTNVCFGPKADIALRHSITSSARNRNDSGIFRLSVFAVFKLIANSYFVGNWTGSSPGFAPRRTRSM